MQLTAAQLAALRADILADPTLSQIDHTNNAGYVAISNAYNVLVAPDFFVYRTSIPVTEVFNQIDWAALTPSQAIPDSSATTGAANAWTNRALMCQAKQFNLQIVLQGQLAISAANAKVRAGLQDALTNVPSTSNGTGTQGAGWNQIRDTVLARKAKRGEKLFADVSGGNGSTAALAATMSSTAEGDVTAANISDAFANG